MPTDGPVMTLPSTTLPMTEEAFERLALDDPEGRWERWDGVARSKPLMVFAHNEVADTLAFELRRQVSRSSFRVRAEKARVRRPRRSYHVPDVLVIPVALANAQRGRPDRLEAYSEPLPLVIAVGSRSTGRYDVMAKLVEYQRRGDAESWLVHPYERTLRAWRRQPDGSYGELLHVEGIVRPASPTSRSIWRHCLTEGRSAPGSARP